MSLQLLLLFLFAWDFHQNQSTPLAARPLKRAYLSSTGIEMTGFIKADFHCTKPPALPAL